MRQLAQAPRHAPAPRFIKWLVVSVVLAAFMVTFAPFVPSKQTLICLWADAKAQLDLGPRAASVTAVCAGRAEPDQISNRVPELLNLLDDNNIATKSYGSVGLHWAKQDDTGTVSSFALEAVTKATPVAANVEPIVTTLVRYAQQVPPRNLKTGKWDHPSSQLSIQLVNLLLGSYTKAGLGPQIADALTAHADEISNEAFWRMHDPHYTYIQTLAHNIRSLTQGRSNAAQTYITKFEAEQAAELTAPPQIKRLPLLESLKAAATTTLINPPPTTQPDALPASRRGTMFHLLEDKERVTSGWVTLWHDSAGSCTQTVPVLCIAGPAPDSVPITWEQLKIMGIFAGAVDARVALTTPIEGTQLVSQQTAHNLCAQQHGPQWRMAQADDSVASDLPPRAWRIANYYYRKGGVVSARASNRDAFKGARYWVAGKEAQSNCWAQ